MCGYINYQDSRLIPPDVNDREDESNFDAHMGCSHNGACHGLLMRLNKDAEHTIVEWADIMGCAECPEWEEW